MKPTADGPRESLRLETSRLSRVRAHMRLLLGRAWTTLGFAIYLTGVYRRAEPSLNPEAVAPLI
jgi:hypothetical protein